MENLERFVKENSIDIAVLTIPKTGAVNVAEKLVHYGIKAIWNFAPTALSAPADILIRNENMASSLALLSRHLVAKSAKNF